VTTQQSASPQVGNVPFLDLSPSHEPLRDRMIASFADLIDSSAFANGPAIADFERAFADACGTARCVGVASGTDALRLGLMALDLEPGSEVVLPTMTFIATAEAVVQAGLEPVFVDVAESDYGIDLTAVEAALTGRTRAVLPVHLYGQMIDMRRLSDLASRHDLAVVEDACQAHGARRDGLTAGAAGTAGAFSFYPGKNLGAMGDAGALVTDDETLAERVTALREHGQTSKHHHEWVGFTSRLDTVQALVLLHKLPHLDSWNDERRELARVYSAELAGVGVLRLPGVAPGSDPVWHLYEIRTARSNDLVEFLAARGIRTGRHYPVPIHLTPAFAHLGLPAGSFPVSEALARELVSLPIYPGMPEEHTWAVVSAITEFFRHG
jgi:dTDP-4-amino-4,6-dideoxygalactose transaminase